jgi:hypothetical protein
MKPALKLGNKKNTNSFTGTVNGFTGTIGITSVGKVDVSSGNATIKPVKNGTLTELIFTPSVNTEFGDFSFRGSVADANTLVEVRVTDQNGNTTCLTCDFTIATANADFARIGVVAQSGSGESIQSVEVTTPNNPDGFLMFKQAAFSFAAGVTPVPEPTTLGLLGVGLVGLGIAGRRKRRRRAA